MMKTGTTYVEIKFDWGDVIMIYDVFHVEAALEVEKKNGSKMSKFHLKQDLSLYRKARLSAPCPSH